MTKVQDGRPTYRGRTIPHHQYPSSPKKQRQPSPPTVTPPPSPPPSSHSPQRKSHISPPDSPQPCFIIPPPPLSNDIETESQSKNKTRHRNMEDGLSYTSPSKSSKVVSQKKILRYLTKIKPSCVTIVLMTSVSILMLYSYRQTLKVMQYFDQSEIMEDKMSLPPITNSSKHRNRKDESLFRNKPRIIYYSGKPYILPAKISLPPQTPANTSSIPLLPPPSPPLVNETCTPSLPFHPTCNLLHELPLHNLTLLSTTGSWRLVFSLSSHAAFKILRLDRPFDRDTYTRHSIDSFAMDALSSSPAIVSEYSFCGQSVVTEVAATEGWRQFVKGKSPGCERLRVGWELAKGMRGMHEGMKGVTLVHNDVNAANVVDVGGRIKFNDFNIGALMKRGCDFVPAFDGVYWRSPEEILNQTGVTEKIDVYSLGNLFFQLLTTREPWKWLEPGSRPPATLVEEKKRRGELPHIPEKYMDSKDVCLRALHLATVACYEFDAEKRLSAAELAKRMGFVVKAFEKGEGQLLTNGRLTKLFKGS